MGCNWATKGKMTCLALPLHGGVNELQGVVELNPPSLTINGDINQ